MEMTVESTFAERAARHANSPRVQSAQVSEGSLSVTLKTGAMVSFPARLLRPLSHLSDEQLQEVRVVADGTTLMWRQADVDIAVEGMLEVVTGLQTLGTIARKGGSTRTPVKAAAARENGKKGGRPRKNPQPTAPETEDA